jgi:hypothetical protein
MTKPSNIYLMILTNTFLTIAIEVVILFLKTVLFLVVEYPFNKVI